MKKWVLIIIAVIIIIALMASFTQFVLNTDLFIFRIPRSFVQNLFSGESSSRLGILNTYDINDSFSESVNGIDSIDISSVSSDITVYITEDPDITVKLYGTYRTDGGKPVKLVMNRNGSSLIFEVDYPKQIGFQSSSDLKMDVYLPKTYEKELLLSSVSGSIYASEFLNDKNQFETVSGDVVVNRLLASEILAESVSGALKLTVENEGSQTRLDVESVSGQIVLDFKNAFGTGKTGEKANIKTVSGKVEVTLPKDSAFKFTFKSTSGSLNSDFPVTLESSDRSTVIGSVNDGNGVFSVETVSGDFKLNRK